jgi:hypothetical protein
MRTGSLVNHLMDMSAENKTAEVGMGVTLCYWSDRHAATVIEVSKTGHEIKVREDKAIRTDSHGMSDAQSYRFEADENGRVYTATRRKDGSYRVKGGDTRVLLGHRSHYFDYSF